MKDVMFALQRVGCYQESAYPFVLAWRCESACSSLEEEHMEEPEPAKDVDPNKLVEALAHRLRQLDFKVLELKVMEC